MFRSNVHWIQVSAIFLLSVCATATAVAQGPWRIRYPSRDFPTIQSALDALRNGGRLEIAAGDYRIDEPLVVTGKNVVIRGAGSGRNGEREVTRLLGPPPRPVVDERGRIVLPADAAQGVFNFAAGNFIVSDMLISGGDAAIVSKDDARGNSTVAVATNLLITDTGRGILSLSSEPLMVFDTTITDCLWHAISVAPKKQAVFTGGLIAWGIGIFNSDGAGIYFSETWAFIYDEEIENCRTAGIAGYKSTAAIGSSAVRNCRVAGIFLQECDDSTLWDNLIEDIFPIEGIFGDGIVLFDGSSANLYSNWVNNSYRASVSQFGSTARYLNNTFTCASFFINIEIYDGVQSVATDLGGNVCGCGLNLVPCSSVSSSLQPPPPVGGLE